MYKHKKYILLLGLSLVVLMLMTSLSRVQASATDPLQNGSFENAVDRGIFGDTYPCDYGLLSSSRYSQWCLDPLYNSYTDTIYSISGITSLFIWSDGYANQFVHYTYDQFLSLNFYVFSTSNSYSFFVQILQASGQASEIQYTFGYSSQWHFITIDKSTTSPTFGLDGTAIVGITFMGDNSYFYIDSVSIIQSSSVICSNCI